MLTLRNNTNFEPVSGRNISHSTCKCSNDFVQTVLPLFFEVFIFSISSKVIITVIDFMLLGINMFWAFSDLILTLTS